MRAQSLEQRLEIGQMKLGGHTLYSLYFNRFEVKVPGAIIRGNASGFSIHYDALSDADRKDKFEVHDTFKLDRYQNPHAGHTTFNQADQQLKVNIDHPENSLFFDAFESKKSMQSQDSTQSYIERRDRDMFWEYDMYHNQHQQRPGPTIHDPLNPCNIPRNILRPNEF